MVRFKNRYLLFELAWKDGKFDDSISELPRPVACLSSVKGPTAAPSTVACMPPVPTPPRPPPPAAAVPADEAVLLAAFRDSLRQNFGDHGLGTALASFQGG